MEQNNLWLTLYLPLATTLVATGTTVVLAILTAKYVKLTGRLVEESKRSRDPLVTVDFEVSEYGLELVVENHGLTPARNVRIQIEQDSDWIRGDGDTRGLSGVQPIRHGISFLAPNRKLKYYAGQPDWHNVPEGPIPVKLSVSYEGPAGEKFHDKVEFNFQQLCEVLLSSFRDPSENVAKAIRDAERSRRSDQRLDASIRRVNARKTKACEMCAEQILVEAKKCKHCGATQESAGPAQAST
jgi:hypothetical protein